MNIEKYMGWIVPKAIEDWDRGIPIVELSIEELKKLYPEKESGMKFWEAVKAMQEGEVIESFSCGRYKFKAGHLLWWNSMGQEWTDTVAGDKPYFCSNAIFATDWGIYKAKKKTIFHECFVEWNDGTESLEHLTDQSIKGFVSGFRALKVTKTGKTKTVEVDK